MTVQPTDPIRHRDRSVEILDRGAGLWQRWRELRREGQPGDPLRAEVLAHVEDARQAGEWIVSEANREALQAEIERWRGWFADELGEYIPAIDLAPAYASGNILQEIDYQNLMILLARGEPVTDLVVKDIEFAKHLDEVREAFSESKLINCRFDRCKFDGTQFGTGTKLVYVGFSECSMDNLTWPAVRASSLAFEDLSIRGARFEGGVFSDVLFRKLRTDRVDFTDANFTYCRFDRVNSEGTDYAGAIFSKCIFEGTVFRACDLSDAVFSECTFIDTTIAGGSLRRALFTLCDRFDLNLTQGPPRGGEASRRLMVDTDLAGIQVKKSHNVPRLIRDYLSIQDLGQVPDVFPVQEGG
jgi:uncharacterized protein YjbI with pentapeptide repeats